MGGERRYQARRFFGDVDVGTLTIERMPLCSPGAAQCRQRRRLTAMNMPDYVQRRPRDTGLEARRVWLSSSKGSNQYFRSGLRDTSSRAEMTRASSQHGSRMTLSAATICLPLCPLMRGRAIASGCLHFLAHEMAVIILSTKSAIYPPGRYAFIWRLANMDPHFAPDHDPVLILKIADKMRSWREARASDPESAICFAVADRSRHASGAHRRGLSSPENRT